MSSPAVKHRTRVVVLVGAALLATVGPAAGPAAGDAAPSAARRTAAADNPLAGRTMGVYKGLADAAWEPFAKSTGHRRTLLAKIARRPKATWFGHWTGNGAIKSKVRAYIAKTTHGNPDVLVQMTVFRMVPWEHAACSRIATQAERSSYRTWIRRFAAAIGDAHVALILQPDGPFVRCAPDASTRPSKMIAFAAKKFSAQPNTSVYIDGGAADWPSKHPELSAQFLVADGIAYARGFALNSTHYSGTGANIAFGSEVVADLADLGVPGRHFVINTSSNGRPFAFGSAPGSDPDNATVCATTTSKHCVTLGIPPTTKVGRPKWGLSALNVARAQANVDAYLWFGRPWLYRQSSPFRLKRALALARTTPW